MECEKNENKQNAGPFLKNIQNCCSEKSTWFYLSFIWSSGVTGSFNDNLTTVEKRQNVTENARVWIDLLSISRDTGKAPDCLQNLISKF